MPKKSSKKRIITPAILIPFIIVTALLLTGRRKVIAAKLADGTWTQSGSPGTTTIVFTNTGALVSGDDIVFSFPSATADVNDSGTNVTCTNQGTPTRTNDDTDNTITVTLDAGISGSTEITCSFTDGLTSYTTTTYAMDSVGINTQDNGDSLIDFGVALLTNDNTTTVTASVPLFVNMAIDTTSIDLGTLSSGSVAEADQTYTFNSNNTSGITVQISTDGLLNDGSGNDINYVTDGTVSAGSEEYGVFIDGTTANLAIGDSYAPGDNDIIQAANTIASSTGTVSSGTFDINYRASISGSTVAGDYDQVVTVTVATNS